jgi:membrane protease YdiL (CAAX protease family)
VVGGALPSIVGGALLFAMVHDVQSWLTIFLVGLALGVVCERTGSIWPTMTLHGLFNGVQLVMIEMMQGA